MVAAVRDGRGGRRSWFWSIRFATVGFLLACFNSGDLPGESRDGEDGCCCSLVTMSLQPSITSAEMPLVMTSWS
ncbi:hypothetical protein BV20DRAFT_324237 [Pilatotrama ljubarskyi]|nr:hypothetical protein BV20DRAFT_324237 [Pilatotrama ljubarskyi]